MNYCEKCHYLLQENSCYNCGNKKLREPKDNDFCFLADLNSITAKTLENSFDKNDIEYVYIPIRLNILNAKFAKDFDHRVYVLYKDLIPAKELLDIIPKM